MTHKKRWSYDSIKHGIALDPIERRLIEERTGVYVGSGMAGPWQAGDKGSTYYVLNVETGEKKKMGKAQVSGINWWERAKTEARHRNELVENQKNYPWMFRKGGKAAVMKELEQVLFTDRIGGNPGHEAIDDAYNRCNLAGCTTKDLNKVLARVDERVKAGERSPGGKKRHGGTGDSGQRAEHDPSKTFRGRHIPNSVCPNHGKRFRVYAGGYRYCVYCDRELVRHDDGGKKRHGGSVGKQVAELSKLLK